MTLVVQCPHCKCLVEIEQLNCRIFRHGTYKHNGKQIPPHSPKHECERLFTEGKIHGCGKPFRIPKGSTEAIVCEYI